MNMYSKEFVDGIAFYIDENMEYEIAFYSNVRDMITYSEIYKNIMPKYYKYIITDVETYKLKLILDRMLVTMKGNNNELS